MTKVGLYAIGTSTTLESNKSLENFSGKYHIALKAYKRHNRASRKDHIMQVDCDRHALLQVVELSRNG